jgi:hypothetical protein
VVLIREMIAVCAISSALLVESISFVIVIAFY